MKRFYICFLAAVALSLGSCTRNFDEINSNPNAPDNLTNPGYLLPNIIRSVANNNMNNSFDYGTVVTDLLASSSGSDFATSWVRSQANNKFCWNYYDYIRDLNDMIQLSETYELNNFKGVALVLRAWMFQNLTDLYGPIHFREASAAKTLGVTRPGFESQEAVYSGLLEDLEEALALLGTSNESITGDILYDGSVVHWKQFATGLMLRLLTRRSDRVDPSAAMQEILDNPSQYPLFDSYDDQAALEYLGDRTENEAPYYQYANTAYQVRRVTQHMVDRLQAINDPRLYVFALPTPTSENAGVFEYKGEVNGTGDFVDPSQTSPPGMLWAPKQFNPTLASATAAQSIFMSYAEEQFILAEAAEKGWISGGSAQAAVFYKNGIADQFAYYASRIPANYADSYLSLEAADVIPADSYYTQAGVAYEGSATEKLEKIWFQKWLASFMVGFEGYSEWRRTGYPQVVAGPVSPGYIPSRMLYPAEELSINEENYDEAVKMLGADDLTTHVWWDVQ